MSKQDRHTVRSPFKFLDAYTREDRDLFFGREEEVEELYQFVQKNRIVLVYGPSGAGKTSLVQCGLANRFEATDWVPFYISRGNDLNESLLAEVGSSRALGGAPLSDEGLLDALERISTRYVRPVYLIFDQFFDPSAILEDIAKRPYITVGFAGYLMLIPLAATSTNGMIKRLGRNWQRLHRLVYLIGMLGVVHYWWLVKADISEPLLYAGLLTMLLGYRAWWWNVHSPTAARSTR